VFEQKDVPVHHRSSVRQADDVVHQLRRQLRLRDLVFAQVLIVVGSSWVGIAAGVGRAQLVVWLLAFACFYAPMAVAVYQLNRQMPLEGGLYVWARKSYGDLVGFMTAWNIWAYALTSIATVLSQIPTEFAYLIGPRAAGLPENHLFVGGLLSTLLLCLGWTTVRGLGVGKWINGISSLAIMATFGLLILAPLIAWLRGDVLHYAPGTLQLPRADWQSLALVGQVMFASAGLEYIAIMAGETHSATTAIGRSVVLATPIILAMFVLGTASVVCFHERYPAIPIDFVAPIPQTLTLAFGGGLAAAAAKLAILLLQIRIVGVASSLFAGAVRLPMAAGWDHLIPEWFTRLHPKHRTPVNAIYGSAAVVAALLVLGNLGVRAVEAFSTLNDASNEFYALAYLAMFSIPLRGAASVRAALPRWVAAICAVGLVATLFVVALNAYPFVDVASPGVFAAKILGTTALVNALGWAFYSLRRRREQPRDLATLERT